jgi:hypothetical protein
MPYLKHSTDDANTEHNAEPIAQYGRNRTPETQDSAVLDATQNGFLGTQRNDLSAENSTNEINQLVLAMVTTAQRLPNFDLIKAEMAADRRETEVAAKTDLLKERNHILEDVRPFIDLMEKERPGEAEY